MHLKLLPIFLLPTLLVAQISFTPSAPVAAAGATITITADRPVTWALTGVGSITPSSTTVDYTAPTGLIPQTNLNGCMVTPDNSVYNTPIDGLPTVASSVTWTASALLIGIAPQFQWGTNLVLNSYPLTPLTFHYTTLLNGTGFPIPALPDKKRETGAYTTDTVADHHMLVVNRQNCNIYETYQEGIPGFPYLAASGYIYNGTSFAQPSRLAGGGATDAASMPLAPLTVHLSELHSGNLHHALRFTSCVSCFTNAFVWPANASTGAGNSSTPPMGSRFRLKPGFDISGYPPYAQVLLGALKHYGMILADVGLSSQFTVSSDVTEDPEVAREIQSIAFDNIGASNFEIVDESSFLLDVTTSAVNPSNPYVVPVNQAALTVTEVANPSNVVTLPVALQAVTVGMPDPQVYVEAGTPAFQIPVWVNGNANQSVTWSINPPTGVGSIDSSGNFTAVGTGTITTPVSATISAISAVDSNAVGVLEVTVFPEPTTVTIDSGSATSTTGTDGFTWLADLGFETGTFNTQNDNYPTYAWGMIPLLTQYQTYMYAYGDDIVYHVHVPNGNYEATFLLGVGMCDGSFNRVFNANSIFGPTNFESQGQIILNSYNFGIPIGYACRTPSPVTIPVVVSDTNLLVALRAVIDGSGNHSAPLVNGLKIVPFSGTPFYTITTPGQVVSVHAGHTLQLTAIPWFVPGGGTPVTWSTAVCGTGLGTVSPTGLYTAPPSVSSPTSTTVSVTSADTMSTGTIGLVVLP